MKQRGRRELVLTLGVMVWSSACSLLKPPECRNPKYISALKEQAVQYYSKEMYIDALKTLKQVEECNPRDAEVYYLIGVIYFKRERTHDAIEYFEKALKLDSSYTEARMGLGTAYLSLNRWDEAISQFEIAVADEFFPRPWEVYNNLAWAYLQKGNPELAEVNATAALRLNEKWCPALCTLGEIYSAKGDKRRAILQYQKAVKTCGKNYARPHFLLGREYGELGYLDKACEEFAAAAAISNAPEAEQAQEFLILYNCPGVIRRPSGP